MKHPEEHTTKTTSLLELNVLAIYAEADAEVRQAGPVCLSSGKCCRFKEYDHTLFISSRIKITTLSCYSCTYTYN